MDSSPSGLQFIGFAKNPDTAEATEHTSTSGSASSGAGEIPPASEAGV